MNINKLATALLVLSISVAACGGGGGGSKEGGVASDRVTDANGSSGGSPSEEGAMPPSSGPSDNGANESDFNATATVAPAEGAVLSDLVRLEVEGRGMENVELLPAEGGRPYALFHVADDKSRAWVDFDTRTVVNGEVHVVINAYDKPPRTDGASVKSAMPPRSWTIQNASVPSPYPGDYPLRRDAEPLQAMIDMDEQEFANLIDTEWPRVHALLQEYIPNNVVFEPPVPRGFEGPRSTCIRDAYTSPRACHEYMIRIVMLLE